MLSQEDATRVAVMANVLRTDWAPNQVLAVLGDERIRVRRTYRETAIAVAFIATDPETRQPTRLLEHGPWWMTTTQHNSASAHIAHAGPDDCAICGQPEADHYHVAVYGDHAYTRQIDHARGVAARRKALQEDA